jgi:O-antigen/teichoic acid export membrane protein
MGSPVSMPRRVLQSGYLRGLVSQGTSSVANFLCVVLLARLASAEDLGRYTVFFAALMIALGVHAALIVTPLRILGVGRDDSYFRAQLTLQLLLIVPTLIVFAGAMFVVADRGALFVAVACAAMGAIILYHFCRYTAFARGRGGRAVQLDLACHGLRYVLIAGLIAAGLWDSVSAIAAFGLGALVAALLSWRDFNSEGHTELADVTRENWRHGRWILLDAVAHSLSNQAYVFFVAFFLGSATAGFFGSGQSLLNVVNMLMAGIMAHGVSRIRRALTDGGYDDWRRSLRNLIALTCTLVLPYLVLVSLIAEPLLRLVYGEDYTVMAPHMAIFALAYALMIANAVFGTAFRTTNQFKVGVAAKVIALLVTMSLGVWLVRSYEIRGVVLGFLATQVTLVLVYLSYLGRGKLGATNVAQTLAAE